MPSGKLTKYLPFLPDSAVKAGIKHRVRYANNFRDRQVSTINLPLSQTDVNRRSDFVQAERLKIGQSLH